MRVLKTGDEFQAILEKRCICAALLASVDFLKRLKSREKIHIPEIP